MSNSHFVKYLPSVIPINKQLLFFAHIDNCNSLQFTYASKTERMRKQKNKKCYRIYSKLAKQKYFKGMC